MAATMGAEFRWVGLGRRQAAMTGAHWGAAPRLFLEPWPRQARRGGAARRPRAAATVSGDGQRSRRRRFFDLVARRLGAMTFLCCHPLHPTTPDARMGRAPSSAAPLPKTGSAHPHAAAQERAPCAAAGRQGSPHRPRTHPTRRPAAGRPATPPPPRAPPCPPPPPAPHTQSSSTRRRSRPPQTGSTAPRPGGWRSS